MNTINLDKMVEQEKQRRLDLYDEHRRQAWEQISDSTDNFDRNLLTLSSGALALSIAFLKDVAHGTVVFMPSLIASWILFSLCIAVTLASFQVSIAAHKKALESYKKGYLDGQVQSKEQNIYARAVGWCTVASGVLFLSGLICTLIFCGFNLSKGSNKNMPEPEKQAIVHPHDAQKGQTPMDMTPSTIPTVPTVTPAPEPAPSPNVPPAQAPAEPPKK